MFSDVGGFLMRAIAMTKRFSADAQEIKDILPDIEEQLADFTDLEKVTVNIHNKTSSEYKALNYSHDLAFV